MKENVVSIIIPVYGVEKYLNQCVESVVNQTYKNIEIILVDDGSLDRCPEMCEEWKKRDSRILVIHKSNAGLGMARNTGLDNASGEYVYFLDSDDYITNDAIEQLFSVAKKENADIVGSGLYRVTDDGILSVGYVPKEYHVYRESEILDLFLPSILEPSNKRNGYVGFTACISGPMFSMKMIKQSGWRCASERTVLSEDIYSFLDMCSNVKCVVAVPYITAYYRCNPTSLSQTYRLDRFEKNKQFYAECQQLAESKGYNEKIKESLLWPFLTNMISAIKQMLASDLPKSEKQKCFKQYLNDPVVRAALAKYDYSEEKTNRRILFFAIENSMYNLAYLLFNFKK